MPHISVTPPEAADGAVAEMYTRLKGKGTKIPDYALLFSHNPALMNHWADMLASIKSGLDNAEFLLANLAVAQAIDSYACQTAFSKRLLRTGFSRAQLDAILNGNRASVLTKRQLHIFDFAVKIACDSANVDAEDTDALREHGLGDSEIFHLAAAASSRCFFARLCDGLGATARSKSPPLPKNLAER